MRVVAGFRPDHRPAAALDTSSACPQLPAGTPPACGETALPSATGFRPPHFHAHYRPDKASIEISSLRVPEGSLPPRVLGLVIEWASQHREELFANWEHVVHNRAPHKIEPLR